jgi:hypothetical protein
MTTLTYTRTRLHDAISALCDPTWHNHHPLPSRYDQLQDAKANPATSGHTTTPPASMIPAQIDALMLAKLIDERTTTITRGARIKSTTGRLQWLTTQKWRPQDIETLEAITAEISSWTKAIDDFFAPNPKFFTAACPQCGHAHAYHRRNDGERVKVQALAITVDKGAWCNHCHQTWTGEQQLMILAAQIA